MAGIKAEQVEDVGYSCTALHEGGYVPDEMKHVTDSTAKELRDGGYALKTLRSIGFPQWQLKQW